MNPNPDKHKLVTGSTGYLGSSLDGEQLCRGYRVIVVDDGGREMLNALRAGLTLEPYNPRYRNAQFIVQ